MTDETAKQARLSLVLTGNPNVGKSEIFSRLTGLGAISSNYPGTTVEYRMGSTRLAGRLFSLTDVPGAYSLASSCKAEEVACDILARGAFDVLVHVVDALNLERNLFFALEAAALGKPMVILLNKWDLAKARGVEIDAAKLSEKLGIPCLPFVAVTGEGLPALEKELPALLAGKCVPPAPPESDSAKWAFIGELSKTVQTIRHRHPGFAEYFQGASIRPLTGLPLALVILSAGFYLVRGIGEGLIGHVVEPLYEGYYLPFLNSLFGGLNPQWLKTLLLGGGESMGLLAEGVKIALGEVLSYVLAFYLALGLLEDTGYLPRLSVLMDNFLHKIGLHGYGTMPILLGLGCKVPGIVAARVLETRRERIIAYAMTLLLAPCMPQSAMIMALLARYSIFYTLSVFGVLALTGLAAGFLLNKVMKGETQELFVEIPPWQSPRLASTLSKLWLRMKSYMLEAVPMILLGIVALDIMGKTGLLDFLSRLFRAPLSAVLGLPPETISVVLLGFLRKDVCIALLEPFSLNPGQIVTASVFLSLYMPCAATFAVLLRETGVRDTARITALTLSAAFVAGASTYLARLLFGF
ncbi:MAG: ferrous iron transporter B [Elusimicrobia bacterium]|nr:ferrous iron transporter B [Elusimicrobiota bacterium]